MTMIKKMVLLVLSALLGMVMLTGIGQYQMNRVYEASNYGNINTVPSLRGLDEIHGEFSNVRPLGFIHALSADDATKNSLAQRITAAWLAIDAAVKKYDTDCHMGTGCISDDKEKALFAEVKIRLADFKSEQAKGIELSAAHKDAQTMDQIMTKMLPAALKANEVIAAQRQYNAELGKKASEEGAAIKASAARTALVVAALTLLAVAGLGFFITRNLMRQLGGEPDEAAEVANRLRRPLPDHAQGRGQHQPDGRNAPHDGDDPGADR
jgi:methyl-accepting chemotaxis protein